MKKATIIARVSTVEQDSNEAQVNRLKEYATLRGFDVHDIHEIKESSSTADRKKFRTIIKEVTKSGKVSHIFVDTIDRLQRSFKESVEFDELRKKGLVELFFYRENLHIHKESNSADLIRWDMGVMFARAYILQLSDNVKRTQEQRRKDGYWTGKPRLGYINVTDEVTEKKDIIPHAEYSHIVHRLFDEFATGQHSVTTLRALAIELGLKTVDGLEPSRSVIHSIIRDPFYMGFALSKKHGKYKHRYKTLTTKETFDRCQDVLDGRNNTRTKEDSKPFVFKGLLFCASCGCAMSPEIKKGKYVYYSCTNAKKICKREYIPEAKLLKPIYKVFEAFAGLPAETHKDLVEDLRKLHESEKYFNKQQIARIQAEYSRVQNRIDKLLDLHLDESITSQEYTKKLHTLKRKQGTLTIELDEHSKGDYEFHVTVNRVLSLTTRMKDIFDSSEIKEKREIVSYLLQNPKMDKKQITFELKKPFNVVLEFSLAAKRAATSDPSAQEYPAWLRRQDSNLRPIDYTYPKIVSKGRTISSSLLAK